MASRPRDIEQRLKNEALGEYREKLVTAYTRSRLATQLAVSSRDAATRGAVSGRLQQQRESEQQASEAAVAAVLEQSLFEAKQSCKVSEAKLADAELQLDISLQELNALLGPAAKKVTVADLGKKNSNLLSEVNLVSPIEGTVEERLLSATERVSAGDTDLYDCRYDASVGRRRYPRARLVGDQCRSGATSPSHDARYPR